MIELTEKELPQSEWGLHLNTPLFRECVDNIINNNNIVHIVECGTNNGEGSTNIFAEYKIPLHSCEANFNFFKKAKEFHKDKPWVKLYNGFTTKKEHVDPIYFKNIPKKTLPQNWLKKILTSIFSRLEEGEDVLVFLDSHWTMGFLEFRVVFDFWYEKGLKNNIFLLLDDATNLKHRPSLRFIENYPELNLEVLQKERWAFVKLPKE